MVLNRGTSQFDLYYEFTLQHRLTNCRGVGKWMQGGIDSRELQPWTEMVAVIGSTGDK